MPALHIRDVPEATVAALKRRAARHGHSVQQELRDVLEVAASSPVTGSRSRPLRLHTVATGQTDGLDRADLYGDDER